MASSDAWLRAEIARLGHLSEAQLRSHFESMGVEAALDFALLCMEQVNESIARIPELIYEAMERNLTAPGVGERTASLAQAAIEQAAGSPKSGPAGG